MSVCLKICPAPRRNLSHNLLVQRLPVGTTKVATIFKKITQIITVFVRLNTSEKLVNVKSNVIETERINQRGAKANANACSLKILEWKLRCNILRDLVTKL